MSYFKINELIFNFYDNFGHSKRIYKMKKDIKVSEIDGVYIVIVPEYNETFKSDDWNVYLVNERNDDVELALIISKGFDDKRETAQMRHKIALLPAMSGVKFELMVESVLQLNNQFKVTFFVNNILYDKVFLAKKNSLKKSALRMVKALGKRGAVFK